MTLFKQAAISLDETSYMMQMIHAPLSSQACASQIFFPLRHHNIWIQPSCFRETENAPLGHFQLLRKLYWPSLASVLK